VKPQAAKIAADFGVLNALMLKTLPVAPLLMNWLPRTTLHA